MTQRLPRLALNFAVAIFLVVITAEYGGKRLGIIDALEKQSYDWRLLRDASTVRKNYDIVIVDIDDRSISDLGPWPWSRDIFAQLTEKMFADFNPLAVGFALPFSEPDNTDMRVLDDVERAFREENTNYNFALQRRVRELRDRFSYDGQFADALRGRKTALGFVFRPAGVEGELPRGKNFVGEGDEAVSPAIMESATRRWDFRRGYSGNIPSFLNAAGGAAGNLGLTLDDDGVVRRVPLFVKHAGQYFTSLPVILLARQKEYDVDFPINAEVEEWRTLLGIGYVMTQFSVGPYTAPLNRDGRAYLHFMGRGGKSVDFRTRANAVFRYISATDVLAGVVPEGNISGKIVLVGSSSPLLRDTYITPVNQEMPGVELMATQMANLMEGSLLSRGYKTNWYELVILSCLLAFLSVLFAFLGPLLSFFVTVAAGGGYVFFVLDQWNENNEVWTMVPLLLALTGLYIFTAISGFAFEWRASRRLQDTFSQYVPPEFAKKMGQAGTSINLEGEGRELTVLFSDVRNFTAISEKLTPHELTVLMNRMLTALTEAIHRHDGTVDKYIGDAVMAFWNAPIFDAEHAKNAVLAAMDMQETMNKLSAELEKEGFQPIRLGVGLCTGDASVGNMGSALRMTYTAIGDTVNLASRTEGLTKHYRTPVLVAETTYEQCKEDIAFRAVDLVQVKGREQPVGLFEPLGQKHLIGSEIQTAAQEFEQFRQAYHGGDFAKASQLLDAYRTVYPDDGLAEVYAGRVKNLLANPPQNWNGVYTHTEK